LLLAQRRALLPGHSSGSPIVALAGSVNGLGGLLKKITVPVLVMHGDDDQIVPYADSGPLSAQLVQTGRCRHTKDSRTACRPPRSAATSDPELAEARDHVHATSRADLIARILNASLGRA
jgi:pimeloyl-ACP methyl ester carboxylesterase